MCLYPKLIKNRKYVKNKKNGGVIPAVSDKRALYVPVGCGKCMECKKQKARNWSVRLQEEIRVNKNGKFVTMTFSDEVLVNLSKDINGLTGYELENEIATLAIRRYLERWRKKHKKSVRHWLVTELGQNKTERVHIHGIIWSDEINDIKDIWNYGHVWIGDYVNEKTINYIVKYVSKTDAKHKEYNSKIMTSAGIGSNYIKRLDSKNNRYQEDKTKETYSTRNGSKIALPIYYRNKIYTEEEKEKLWLMKLDKEERWINGMRIDISKGEEEYFKTLEEERKLNKRLGYGDDKRNWERTKYENERRNINKIAKLYKNSRPPVGAHRKENN